jgi:membrane protease YdiL (CAAX protease family)
MTPRSDDRTPDALPLDRKQGRSRWLPFVPSLMFGLAGALWFVASPPMLGEFRGPGAVALIAGVVGGLLLGGAWVLERTLPSFRWASRVIESAVAGLRLTRPQALLLAAATAAGEELFFRGGLMQILGVGGQALVFGLMHPMSRRGWAYTVFTMLAGVLFGYSVIVTGSLWTAMLAHFAVNLHGLLTAPRRAGLAPLATEE